MRGVGGIPWQELFAQEGETHSGKLQRGPTLGHIKYKEANCQTQKQTLPGILYADKSAPMLTIDIMPLSLIDQGG